MRLLSVFFNSFVVTGILLVLSSDCYAYLDAGTTSYIMQIVITAAVTIAIAVKSYWFRIKTFLSRFSRKNLQSPDASPKD